MATSTSNDNLYVGRQLLRRAATSTSNGNLYVERQLIRQVATYTSSANLYVERKFLRRAADSSRLLRFHLSARSVGDIFSPFSWIRITAPLRHSTNCFSLNCGTKGQLICGRWSRDKLLTFGRCLDVSFGLRISTTSQNHPVRLAEIHTPPTRCRSSRVAKTIAAHPLGVVTRSCKPFVTPQAQTKCTRQFFEAAHIGLVFGSSNVVFNFIVA